MSPFVYFTDPVLRAPTIGCMLMCLSAALVGVIAFLRKQSLLGESLSHAAYPGVILGVVGAGFVIGDRQEEMILSLFILAGAFLSSLFGLWLIHLLELHLKVRSDSALCLILSLFFGIGLTLASRIQFTHTTLYQQIQVYLYGQAATMTDWHIAIYGTLAILVLALVVSLYKELQVITFDRDYAKSLGIPTQPIDFLTFALIVFAVVIGIRSVGVVLMSAMLIAPAAAARQFTHKLYWMLFLAGLFGVVSGFLGNYLSVEISRQLSSGPTSSRLILPTGPMIVVVAGAISLFALLGAPERGLLLRLLRVARFRDRCICENILKTAWRFGEKSGIAFDSLAKYQSISFLYLHFILWRLVKSGWMEKKGKNLYCLTHDGQQRGAHIVRLHRLWEVYLADYLGVGAEKVHRNAEEMEHIITPELEKELTELLHDPKRDPHHQPIPPKEGV